jgi:hypothetical protein
MVAVQPSSESQSAASATTGAQAQQTERMEFPVDAEHSGIRAAGCGAFTVLLVVGFVLGNILIANGAVFGLILGLATAAVGAQLLDRYLKQNWPSGRKLVITPERVLLSRHDKVERQINPQQQVNPLFWCFPVKRGGRVKKGWFVVALSLAQDETFVPMYSFFPPDAIDNLPLAERFEQLQRPSKVNTGSEREMKLAGKQRRLYEAEQDRGWDGAELTQAQFQQMITHLQRHYPQWMPKR